jgi:hypothetical protein
MNARNFQTAVLDTLKNYWRIKAANALYRASPLAEGGQLVYANVPAVGLAAQNFESESAAHALEALQGYIVQRLPRDLFLALIAQFEARLVAHLRGLSQPGEGPLGALQAKVQARISLPQGLIEDANEIRERRNSIIHNAGAADSKYVVAAALVAPRASPFVVAVAKGSDVSPSEGYITYAGDVLVRYSNAMN